MNAGVKIKVNFYLNYRAKAKARDMCNEAKALQSKSDFLFFHKSCQGNEDYPTLPTPQSI